MHKRNWTHALLNGIAFGVSFSIGWWFILVQTSSSTSNSIFLETFIYLIPSVALSVGLLFALIAKLTKQGQTHNFFAGESSLDIMRWIIFGGMGGLAFQFLKQIEVNYGSGLGAVARVVFILLAYIFCFRLIRFEPKD